MLNVQITNRHTSESVTISVSSFPDYCNQHGWVYEEAKEVIGRSGIHYHNYYLKLIEQSINGTQEEPTNELSTNPTIGKTKSIKKQTNKSSV